MSELQSKGVMGPCSFYFHAPGTRDHHAPEKSRQAWRMGDLWRKTDHEEMNLYPAFYCCDFLILSSLQMCTVFTLPLPFSESSF